MKSKLVKAYIIDDNRSSIDILKKMLEDNYSVEVIGTTTDAQDGLRGIEELSPDILFLDIEMPDISGLEACSTLKDILSNDTKVVFYTGYNKYMLDAIRRQAFDYLLKPIQASDLSTIMNRYYEHRLSNIRTVATNSNATSLPILVVNSTNEHLALKTNDIAYFRYNLTKKVWEIISSDTTVYTLRHRTSSDIILAHSKQFVQIHKRFIVNINFINKIQDNTCFLTGQLSDITELKVSKNYKKGLMDSFYDL